MTASGERDFAAEYGEYGAALAALLAIPAELSTALSAADDRASMARKAADGLVQQTGSRIATLQRTAATRYTSAVEALGAHGVLLPAQVRPEPASAGDEGAVRDAIEAHAAAVAAVQAAIDATARAAARAKDDAADRAQAGQQAALALKLRQERLRQERAEAAARDAEERARAAEAHRRRRRILLSTAIAGIVVAATAIVIILLITPH